MDPSALESDEPAPHPPMNGEPGIVDVGLQQHPGAEDAC